MVTIDNVLKMHSRSIRLKLTHSKQLKTQLVLVISIETQTTALVKLKRGENLFCLPFFFDLLPFISNSSYLKTNILSPVVQSVVNLTSSLVVKMLTVLVSTIPNSQVFLLKKM